ncbi:MAG: type V CRISPR-associated endonuclease Cas1 [Weeksellaceae bacterium]|nr:type V CRISPR-associated endonuclease Cas1 [Bacteroidota bacterium]MCG2779414.1 type V CRISPR-associated endonuclease Cas1 [Weeksellaceae bacterium]
MHSHKDIENKSLFLINGTKNQVFKVQNGFLCIQNSETKKAVTKLPFPKMLCIMIIGHTSITTAFIEHANKHGVPLVVMKPNFKPVYFFGTMSEGNYLLRKRQFHFNKADLSIAKHLLINKIENSNVVLEKTKRKSAAIDKFKNKITPAKDYIRDCTTLYQLMAAEGRMASYYFSALFERDGWQRRIPRAKIDFINSTLDIGYTFLFNYVEANARLFGFDLYVGVMHQLWFQRKSLVCDLQEPFRCIIDHCVYLALQKEQITSNDFRLFKGSYYIKPESRSKITKLFYEAIIAYKMPIYKYIQSYYRNFMKESNIVEYPTFFI